MRIAIDCRYVRERPSGIGAYVEELVNRLPQLAPEAVFHFWAHRLARKPLSRSPNVFETRVTPEPNSLWPILWPERYASLEGIDVFHGAHNILPRNIRCPSVVTIHDILPLEHPSLSFVRWTQRPKRIYYVQALRRALREATRLIVTTSPMADRLRALFPETSSRVDVVPMGVSGVFRPAVDRCAAVEHASSLIGFREPYVLVVGHDTPNKRHDLALTAFAKHIPAPWRLVFVQRQAKHPRLLIDAIHLGVADRASWFGQIDIEHLVTLYQGAGALLQTSSYEGFGLPVLEAMACGCPVVATDLKVFREVIGNAGVLVGDDNPTGFGRALWALLESRAWREELTEAGIERARGFSWDRCARQTLEVLYHAAGETAPASLHPAELHPVAA
jgi:glycosyltransferase involved in cell wall biosynthesis